MMTVHASGGVPMMAAAVEAVRDANPEMPPALVGVTVLTSVDEATLREQIGIARSPEEHVLHLARLAIAAELDGVVCSAHEVPLLRRELGREPLLVTPGIRTESGDSDDQARTATGGAALAAGANYIVVGRALTNASDPGRALAALGL
jgi:orotidine-5'-phosphate decarboxylase